MLQNTLLGSIVWRGSFKAGPPMLLHVVAMVPMPTFLLPLRLLPTGDLLSCAIFFFAKSIALSEAATTAHATGR